MMSIRNRLVLWLLLPLIPSSILFAWAVFSQVRETTQSAYDQVLLGSALAIADRVVLENDSLSVDVPYAALQMLTRAAEERVFYAVISLSDQSTVTGYRNIPQIDLSDEAEPVFKTLEFRGDTVRIVGIKDRALSYGQERPFAVYVAETTDRRSEIIQRLFRLSIIASGFLVIGTFVITLIAVFWGLRPLNLLADAISERGGKDLSPIERRAPPEAMALVHELNALLKRLATALDSHRSFVRTVSHQLRTPLAELKAEIELTQDQSGTDLDRQALTKRVDNLSHLVGQILMLSRVEDQQKSQETAQEIDLVKVGQTVIANHWNKANASGIDLGLDALVDIAIVKGNTSLLEEALKNLIDNVSLHAKNAKTATVRVSTDAIAVTDDGVGQKHLLRNLEGGHTGRFGLAIVKQIAELMSATLREVPGGLEIYWDQKT